MKKLLSLLLIIALVLSLCACGSSDAEQPAPEETRKSEEKEEDSGSRKGGLTSVSLDEEIDLGYATLTFTHACMDVKIGGRSYRPATEGMQFFCLTGTMENTCGTELQAANFVGEMVFSGEYTFTASAAFVYGDANKYTLPPLMEGQFVIFAEVPENLGEHLTDCTVRFAVNEEFGEKPEDLESGDQGFEIYLDEDVCAKALEGPIREMVYFEHCPILPTPVSYASVFQSGSSTSSRNGKTTSISVRFGASAGIKVDLNEVAQLYLTKIQEADFEVVNGTDIYSGSTKLATMTVDSSSISFDIVPGNENLTAPAAGSAPAEGDTNTGDTELTLGQPMETEYVHMQLDSTGSAQELRSGKRGGSYSYYTSQSGNPYFYLDGTVKNLGGAPVDLSNVYITFTFDGKYTYPGDSVGYQDGTSSFIRDLSPLTSSNCYIYAEIPQEVIDSYTTCEVRIGFTENFDYCVVDVNDLPKFENCEDTFVITISR